MDKKGAILGKEGAILGKKGVKFGIVPEQVCKKNVERTRMMNLTNADESEFLTVHCSPVKRSRYWCLLVFNK